MRANASQDWHSMKRQLSRPGGHGEPRQHAVRSGRCGDDDGPVNRAHVRLAYRYPQPGEHEYADEELHRRNENVSAHTKEPSLKITLQSTTDELFVKLGSSCDREM